jgi:hypothetical protein
MQIDRGVHGVPFAVQIWAGQQKHVHLLVFPLRPWPSRFVFQSGRSPFNATTNARFALCVWQSLRPHQWHVCVDSRVHIGIAGGHDLCLFKHAAVAQTRP